MRTHSDPCVLHKSSLLLGQTKLCLSQGIFSNEITEIRQNMLKFKWNRFVWFLTFQNIVELSFLNTDYFHGLFFHPHEFTITTDPFDAQNTKAWNELINSPGLLTTNPHCPPAHVAKATRCQLYCWPHLSLSFITLSFFVFVCHTLFSAMWPLLTRGLENFWKFFCTYFSVT